MADNAFGKDIQRLRKQAGMSLRELSRKASMSPASISAIEKDDSSPTLATLQKILKALGTNFVEFFTNSDQVGESPVFPGAKMRSIEDAHRSYTLLFPRRNDLRFELIRETISPKETESEWERHDFDIGGVVLGGELAHLEIEGTGQWQLIPGDAFYVKAGQKHRAVNLGHRPLELITVVHPPRY
ncbi:MAG: helix-turn-helix domain-containing protein [Actinobacteria bacterium]|nr:helix-turn-helix domain-containing protein [Actinomycetota bacterium]